MYYQISSHCWSLLTVLQIFSTVFGSTNPYVVICCVSLSVSFNLEIPFLFFFSCNFVENAESPIRVLHSPVCWSPRVPSDAFSVRPPLTHWPTERRGAPGLGSLPGEKPAGGRHGLHGRSMFSARTEDWILQMNDSNCNHFFLIFQISTLGFHGLMYDNKTESMRTINLLQRMNIYQEVFLSILYRVLPIQVRCARWRWVVHRRWKSKSAILSGKFRMCCSDVQLAWCKSSSTLNSLHEYCGVCFLLMFYKIFWTDRSFLAYICLQCRSDKYFQCKHSSRVFEIKNIRKLANHRDPFSCE